MTTSAVEGLAIEGTGWLSATIVSKLVVLEAKEIQKVELEGVS